MVGASVSSRRVAVALAAVVISSQVFFQEVSAQCTKSGDYCGNDQSGPSCCESGNYCQPWNPSYYQCRPNPAKCGVPEVGTDYVGDDLSSFEGMKLPDDCCNKCAETAGCVAYTFDNRGWNGKSQCYLKKGTGTRASKIGLVSAVVSSASGSTCSTKNGDYCGNSRGTYCCPDSTYCQPWNSDFYQCKDIPAKCSTQLTDVDFYGSDMGRSERPCVLSENGISGRKSSVGAVSGMVTLHVQSKIRSGAVQSKAVNLGAWFVSEYWMSWDSPLWKDVPVDTAWRGEYTVMKYLGKAKGTAAFEEHRKT
ncbi:uncharacterized protein KRP23_9728 [Phytophthora ramorum]|uniref:uncharacterized protein n=1 Tax=Phytophthora ramorum TaxID=164328 RepID=UPI0030A64739|nr:hypothetical protein KRP23_9728 [Phytophthora ramorum]